MDEEHRHIEKLKLKYEEADTAKNSILVALFTLVITLIPLKGINDLKDTNGIYYLILFCILILSLVYIFLLWKSYCSYLNLEKQLDPNEEDHKNLFSFLLNILMSFIYIIFIIFLIIFFTKIYLYKP